MEAFISWLSEHYPIVFLVIVAIIATWFVAKGWFQLHNSVKSHGDKIAEHETRFEKVDEVQIRKSLKNHDERMAWHESRLDKVDEAISEIKETLLIIKTHLIEKDSKVAKLLSGKTSPRRLNESGMAIFREFDGERFLKNNREYLTDKIEAKRPQTALDVEKYALEVLYECVNNGIFNDVKVKVYNSKAFIIKYETGEEISFDITMNDICFVFSIELRDIYLSAHPEVRVE